jgi:thiamine-monophosphate kinase
VLHICKQSGLGCVLYEEKIPISEETRKAAFKFEIDPTACALSGGEDYELVFTIRQSDYEKVVLNEEISPVGFMTEAEQGSNIITKGGSKYAITAQGWNSLSSEPGAGIHQEKKI